MGTGCWDDNAPAVQFRNLSRQNKRKRNAETRPNSDHPYSPTIIILVRRRARGGARRGAMRDGRRAASAAGNHNTLPLLLLLLLALGASGNGVSAFLLRAQQSQHAAANLQGDAALNATNDSTPDLQKSSSIEAAGGEQSHACRVSANDVYATTAWKGIAPQNVCDQRNELFDCHDRRKGFEGPRQMWTEGQMDEIIPSVL